MAYDAHKNFAYSTVLTAPSPATSGTSLVVQSGDGTKFPTAPFNATVWPAGSQPTTANAEVVRVTGISTDTLTITRAQESSSARTVIVGDQISASITAKNLTDVEQQLYNPYKFKVKLTNAQNANNTSPKIQFNSEDFDTNNNFDSTTNFNYTAPVSGFYQFNAHIELSAVASQVILYLAKNGSLFESGTRTNTGTNSDGLTYANLVQLSAGDTVDIRCYADSSSALTLSSPSQPYFSGYLVSQT